MTEVNRFDQEAASLWSVAAGLDVQVTVNPSPEVLEEIVAEVITSAPVGLCATDDVLAALKFLKIPDPEQYRDRIDRMIVVDRGEDNE